ncbi:integral membrane [Fusarium albosuccineum]|uniref:Integral membrane n=1 Tax=Fusarium albosuccineum TaxID=1237068 RepID=A0A8H4PDV2_9HYPO|nr:integral membrane [Fusarium albosuccineum]
MAGDRGMGFPTDGVDNQGWKLYITSLVMIIAAGLFVIARCSTRYWMHKLGSDDAAVVVSLLSSIVVSVAMQLAVQHGYGMHKVDLEKPELRMALKMFFIAQTPYKVTVCLNKVAAILLYLRLFVTKGFRIACYTVMGIIVAWSIGGVGATIFQCVPIAAAWDKSVDATCIDSNKFWIAYAVMNILTDIMVLALPIVPIMKLQMNMRERLMLCGVFLIGGFVTITSILRTTSVQNSLKNKEDITYNFIERGMWTLIEANLGIISACLPVLHRPMGKLFPRIFGSTKKSSGYFTGGDHSKGYNLSNMYAHASHPGFWRGTTRSHQVVSVSGPEAVPRKSDERHIITESMKGSDVDSELDSRGSGRGISKRVDVIRTSFHEDDRR